MPSSLIGSDLSVSADGSGQGSAVVADIDCNAQTMEWLLKSPEIQGPAGESDMGKDLSMMAGSDTLMTRSKSLMCLSLTQLMQTLHLNLSLPVHLSS